MNNKDIVLSVQGLGKRFSRTAGSGLDFFRWNKTRDDSFWALRDVSFNVERGTGIGIIGGNGAGKSTLLKILARIVSPTEGVAEIKGRVNSLLEVGTGFQSDLSGRANIYLNASILGMSRAETDAVFDEIVSFSGIGDFIDMPVKHYSSGMYSRLAFSVAANVTGDILLVDEVLSVGDAEFQKKCLKRMNGLLSSEHRTVLFVSHSMDAVMKFCSHALWLDHGTVKAYGKAEDVVAEYLRSVNNLGSRYVSKHASRRKPKAEEVLSDAPSIGPVESNPEGAEVAVPEVKPISTEVAAGFEAAATINTVTLINSEGHENDIFVRDRSIRISLDCQVSRDAYTIHPVIHLHCLPRAGVPDEVHVFTCVGDAPLPRMVGHFQVIATIPDHLLTVGQYAISVALVTRARPQIKHCKLERVVKFQVIEKKGQESEYLSEQLHGVIQPELTWQARQID